MGVAKKTRKFAQTKRIIGRRDARLQPKPGSAEAEAKKKKKPDEFEAARHIPQEPSHMFFEHNEALQPPYQIILDTNFFSHAVRNKIDIQASLMDLLLAKCTPVVTDCTIAELEKLGTKFRLALRVARDERWNRLTCSHAGTYADDCIVTTVMQHRIYLVGTNDKELRQRLRKVKGVPLVSVGKGRCYIERLPSAT